MTPKFVRRAENSEQAFADDLKQFESTSTDLALSGQDLWRAVSDWIIIGRPDFASQLAANGRLGTKPIDEAAYLLSVLMVSDIDPGILARLSAELRSKASAEEPDGGWGNVAEKVATFGKAVSACRLRMAEPEEAVREIVQLADDSRPLLFLAGRILLAWREMVSSRLFRELANDLIVRSRVYIDLMDGEIRMINDLHREWE